jgi:hypothetical protein
VQAEWVAKDTAFYAAMGLPDPGETPLPNVAVWWQGMTPSALDGDPRSTFPNLVVMAYESAGGIDPQADQYEPIRNTLYIELACATLDEASVNRQIKRYAQALHRAVLSDPTLSDGNGGLPLTDPLDQSPTVRVSNASARRESADVDTVWYVQLCRLDYAYRVNEPW